MFATAGGPDIFERNQNLRRLTLNRDYLGGFPPSLKLYCFLFSGADGRGRSSGVSGVINPHGSYIFSEIVYPPFGYVLAFDTPPIDRRLVDISFFGRHAYREQREVFLQLPVMSAFTPLPGDYRSRNELPEWVTQS
jgi:hypothetical protein